MKTNEDKDVDTSSHPQSPGIPSRMGEADASSPHESRSDEGQSSGHAAIGHPSRENRDDTTQIGDHLRKRHIERVPTPKDVGQIEEALLEAFKQGSPEQAFEIAQELVELALRSVMDAAKARFSSNFGTNRCVNCDGLKVGPGVVATCFQLSQCYFKNFKQEDMTPKQSRILRVLSG